MIFTDQLRKAERARRRACRAHGGVKATSRRAWEHDDAVAFEIRDIVKAHGVAQIAERATKRRVLLAVVNRCLGTMSADGRAGLPARDATA